MLSRSLILLAALVGANPLVAQQIPDGPRLLRVAGSSDGGMVLALDSASIARGADSVFVADVVYQHNGGRDRQVESEAMDCAHDRFRGRRTSYFNGDRPVPVSAPDPPREWQPVGEDEAVIFQAVCQYLLSSFAASLPVTRQALAVEEQPEISNRGEVAQALSRAYPRGLRDAGTSGAASVRILIREDGRVEPDSVRVLWATRREFADAAMFVLRRVRFRPAREDGHPVAVWANLPVTFGLMDDGASHPPGPPARANPPAILGRPVPR